MPHAEIDSCDASPPTPTSSALSRLPFPSITKFHILNCSVPQWYQRYKTLTPRTRLIPLSSGFISYLRSDGIILPPEAYATPWSTERRNEDPDSDDEPDVDPSEDWPQIHKDIKSVVAELGGKVYPKLNWSAPKDATWIAATNTMECNTPNDVYLLLKSSDFVTHDLEHAFDDCDDSHLGREEIPYTLVLRKAIPAMINSMEFRCFVRRRRLIGVCQRDLNHYEFMESLVPILQDLLYDFFQEKLKNTFPDDNFVFDVYIPKPIEGGRVWLIDINPWAQRTDPLLFSWLELLTIADLPEEEPEIQLEEGFLRLSLQNGTAIIIDGGNQRDISSLDSMEDDEEELPWLPEIRTVKRGDPEAYSFNTPLYGAHKLPKDVVDAGMTGEGGMRDFLSRWERRQADPAYDSEDGDS